MSIPARPDYDPDLVIGAALGDVDSLVAKVEELADELHHAIDHHVVRGDNRTVCVECGRIDGHALGCWVGEAEKALRAPGGGEG